MPPPLLYPHYLNATSFACCCDIALLFVAAFAAAPLFGLFNMKTYTPLNALLGCYNCAYFKIQISNAVAEFQ